MSSDSRNRNLRLYNEILRAKTVAEVPCDKCFATNSPCYIMPNSNLKCAECTKLGKPCVNMSWSSLDRTREEYQKKVDADEKLLAEVVTRLMRNKKILRQAEERARKKTLCLASELVDDGELEFATEIDCPAADALVGFSPMMWSTLGALDQLAAPAMAGDASTFGGS